MGEEEKDQFRSMCQHLVKIEKKKQNKTFPFEQMRTADIVINKPHF